MHSLYPSQKPRSGFTGARFLSFRKLTKAVDAYRLCWRMNLQQ